MPVHEILIGNSVRLTANVTDLAGDVEEPGDIRLRLRMPGGDGFLNAPGDLVLTVDVEAGEAVCVFKPETPGVYAYRWWLPGEPGAAFEGLFRVRDTALGSGGAVE